MIVSFKYGFIFLKVPKTGGTSLEIALSRYCGPLDIVTPLSYEDERSRIRNGFVGSRNYSTDRKLVAGIRKAVIDCNEQKYTLLLSDLRRRPNFHEHMDAESVRDLIPSEFWSSAFKFTVERHPYEKVVSMAFYRAARWETLEDRPNHLKNAPFPVRLEILLGRIIELKSYDHGQIYKIENKLIVDEILRTERLEEDAKVCCRKLGLIGPLKLSRAKSQYRLDKRLASEILSGEQKEKIFSDNPEIFALMNYPK